MSRRGLVVGFGAGFLALVVLEAAGMVIFTVLTRKTPEEMADILKPPPIPSSVDADYDLKLKSLEGEVFDFNTLRGKVVFLTFWNPDCASCLAELATIQTLYEKTGGDNVAFAVVDVAGEPDAAAEVVEMYHLTMPVYTLAQDRPAVYRSSTIPSSFVITPGGKIGFKHVGAAKWDEDAAASFLLNMVGTSPK